MPHIPAHVANAFLYRAAEEGVSDMTPLKVQKLVYCMHGWHLAVLQEPSIGEFFEAWPYGPVLSSLYHEFKKYGRDPVVDYAREIDPMSGSYRTMMVTPENKSFYSVFDKVWARYKGMSGVALSALTHAPGTPWTLARARGSSYLSNEEIELHFREIAAGSLSNGGGSRTR